MKAGRVHIIGAGLAGMSAAVALIQAGRAVCLYEAAPVAGGRCRSYFDRVLNCRVDNGNHLLLSGNRAAMEYLRSIGAAVTLTGPTAAEFPFMDLTSGARWTLRPNAGRIPWWILSPSRRVPGTRARDYLALRRLRQAGSVADVLRQNTLYHRLLAPLTIAALNTPPEQAMARLLAAVVDETLAAGGAACIPRFPRLGMSETFINPAVKFLTARGADIAFNRRITALEIGPHRITALHGHAGPIGVATNEDVILATPPWIAQELLPGLVVPDAFQAIVNVHFHLDAPRAPGFIGLVGGVAEWVFTKPGHASVTISAANRLVDEPAESLAATTWQNVRAALNLPAPMPVWRVVKERRASFAATQAQEARRPAARTRWQNLALAGDWTATGLPATIEGAIRSGQTAAALLGAD